jgi:hypothetical protein
MPVATTHSGPSLAMDNRRQVTESTRLPPEIGRKLWALSTLSRIGLIPSCLMRSSKHLMQAGLYYGLTKLGLIKRAELSMALSHKLVELVSEGVTDPQELRRLALASFSVALRSSGDEVKSS